MRSAPFPSAHWMAQIPFGLCLNRRALQPFLNSPDVGTYTVPWHTDPCVSGDPKFTDDKRRPDVTRNYERGVPSVTTMADVYGMATAHASPLTTHQTEQGPIALPTLMPQKLGYMPNSSVLQSLPYFDTRISGISDRYYK